jgi:hypothetical protein
VEKRGFWIERINQPPKKLRGNAQTRDYYTIKNTAQFVLFSQKGAFRAV